MDAPNGNIQQRVFDLFPPYPRWITLDSLVDHLPFEKTSVYRAIKELKRKKQIEAAPQSGCAAYRRSKKARRPIDMRGHHGNSGRPRAGQ